MVAGDPGQYLPEMRGDLRLSVGCGEQPGSLERERAMSGRVLGWLVGKWQWPYAGLFAAGFLVVLAPLVFHAAGTALGLIYLQLPIYMLHQYEEHAGDRFRLWVNNMIGHGQDVLTPIATFWINSILVWGLDITALYLACFVNLSLGLIAIYLPMLNAFGHIIPAIIKRKYNPGLATSLVLFLPVGLMSTMIVSQAAGSDVADHLLALGVAIGVHGVIIAHVRRRLTLLAGPKLHAATA
jgi:hypothetical protein